MDTVILKFGGSSVADNIKLNIVAEKVIEFKQKTKNVVVVVSAQGKTTDTLIKEAHELSAIPEEREMDMLLSTGEQITASKLSILLNRKGYKAISLTGWQAGIKTNCIHQSAKIEQIHIGRIKEELEKEKIVIIAGFQGINEKQDITTLGRGGSDTTAVALTAGLKADKCYIFSDVDGIYSADPNIIKIAKKLDEISFDEMQEIADAGAKVLHNRCIQISEKFNCNIVAKSTFSNGKGTKICKKIEISEVKSIVKNENLVLIQINKQKEMKKEEIYNIYQKLLEYNLIVEEFKKERNSKIEFIIEKSEQNKVQELLEKEYLDYDIKQTNIAKISVIGYGIIQDNKILEKIIATLKQGKVELLSIKLAQSKIEVLARNIENSILEELHQKLIKN